MFYFSRVVWFILSKTVKWNNQLMQLGTSCSWRRSPSFCSCQRAAWTSKPTWPIAPATSILSTRRLDLCCRRLTLPRTPRLQSRSRRSGSSRASRASLPQSPRQGAPSAKDLGSTWWTKSIRVSVAAFSRFYS